MPKLAVDHLCTFFNKFDNFGRIWAHFGISIVPFWYATNWLLPVLVQNLKNAVSVKRLTSDGKYLNKCFFDNTIEYISLNSFCFDSISNNNKYLSIRNITFFAF